MSPELHERVMNRASRLWHECGRPHGRYREFWEERFDRLDAYLQELQSQQQGIALQQTEEKNPNA